MALGPLRFSVIQNLPTLYEAFVILEKEYNVPEEKFLMNAVRFDNAIVDCLEDNRFDMNQLHALELELSNLAGGDLEILVVQPQGSPEAARLFAMASDSYYRFAMFMLDVITAEQEGLL